jgi:hypothetical protein
MLPPPVERCENWERGVRENVELVRRLYAELAREGAAQEFVQRLTANALSRFLDPGIEWVPVTHSLLAVDSYRGFDGVRRFWSEFLSLGRAMSSTSGWSTAEKGWAE